MYIKERDFNLIDIVRLPFRFAPGCATIMAVQKILGGIIPAIQLLVTAKFIDSSISVVNGKADISSVYMPVLLVILLIAYSWTSGYFFRFVELRMEFVLREEFRVLVTEKRGKLKYRHIENQKTWDLISRVSNSPEIQCKNAYNDLLETVAMIVRIVGLLTILAVHVWWAVFVILGISIPLFYLAIKSGKANYDATREVSKYNRTTNYLGEVLKGREGVDERTLFGYSEAINNKWYEVYETGRLIGYKVNKKWFIRAKSSSIITTLISILIVLVLLQPVSQGLITVGLFISITNGVFNLIQMISWQLPFYIDQLTKNKEYLNDFSQFIKLEESEGALDKPNKNALKLISLEFRNVSFKYPGTESYILKNMSFVIEEGKHYAFVGVNGAGKTTITKLITGLYDEFEGDILINCKSIREYSQSELKSLTSVVYQDFAKYFITFKDNISLGNINEIANNEEKIKHAINTIGLEIAASGLHKGINTPLGKIKSHGQDLSGGEWQRLGMARSIVSSASLRILDEPTAALDPLSESSIYENFQEISRGGTTIFISHRLASTKLASTIFVIEDGTILERGSHEDLVALDGVYANMYESQRSWYL